MNGVPLPWGRVTEPLVEFQFMQSLRGYPESIPTWGISSLERYGGWTPTEKQPAVRIDTDHGSVLVAAKGANVSVQTLGESAVVVRGADEGDGSAL